jgi:hypothetical protein
MANSSKWNELVCSYTYSVTFWLKARIVEEEKTPIARFQKLKQETVAREWLCKHVSMATKSCECRTVSNQQ